jgi:hypothetical protein
VVTGIMKPYVHQAYFNARTKAERCGAELVVRGFSVGPVQRPDDRKFRAWLLWVGRETKMAEWQRQNNQVAAIVRSYGGRCNRSYWVHPSRLGQERGDTPTPPKDGL